VEPDGDGARGAVIVVDDWNDANRGVQSSLDVLILGAYFRCGNGGDVEHFFAGDWRKWRNRDRNVVMISGGGAAVELHLLQGIGGRVLKVHVALRVAIGYIGLIPDESEIGNIGNQ